MSHFDLEITAHHFTDQPMRDYGKPHASAPTVGRSLIDLVCQQNAAFFLQLEIDDWLRVDDDWWACTLWLRSPEGYNLGRRPALIYAHPSDVPVHVLFKDRNVTITVGLRTVSVS